MHETHRNSACDSGAPVVAIAGGGASGTLAAIHLLDRARVVLIDDRGRHGRGVAYSTRDPAHLLNTPAAAMSAFSGDPGHLVRWATDLGRAAGGGDFLTRYDYGDYLRDTLAARELRHGGLELRTDRVTAIEPGPDGRPVLRLAAYGPLTADAAILATGHLAPPAPPGGGPFAGCERYAADPWSLAERQMDGDVLLIGTGLTMIDLAVSLTRDNPGITVHAISRHGLLPHAHAPVPAQPAPPALAVTPGATTPVATSGWAADDGSLPLAALVRAVREVVGAQGDWRAAVDGLRPRIPELWARLGVADRRRFLDRLARYWEVHRHRMPYPTAREVGRLRQAGRLRIHRGSVTAAEKHRDRVTVRISGGRSLDIALIVRCTGPGADVTADAGLPGTLVATGLARPDPLRLGLDTDDGALLDPYGRPHAGVFTLGPLRRGALYESTAVPEIRAQAERLATLFTQDTLVRGVVRT